MSTTNEKIVNVKFDIQKQGKMLSKGGYGSVYEYKEIFQEKQLCVKIVQKSDLGLNENGEEKSEIYMQREFDNLIRLKHQNIVSIFSVDLRGEFCYFLMEKIDGSSMRTIISSQRKKKRISSFFNSSTSFQTTCFSGQVLSSRESTSSRPQSFKYYDFPRYEKGNSY